ncbi:MAG: putative GTP-binding protein EngB, partial [Pedosphaera sp.]|nr:putative GTP-binding protein EngB [Pedosphaera sp.]
WLIDESVPFVLVFTKTDKSKTAQLQKNMELFKESISQWCEEPPKMYSCSSVTRCGVPELLGVVNEALSAEQEDRSSHPPSGLARAARLS